MIDFPASPTDGQIFSATNGVVYKYSAAYSSWLAQNPAPPLGGTGQVTAASSSAQSGMAASTDVQIAFGTVQAGNAGLWWNTSTNRYTPPAGSYFLQCNSNVFAPSGGNGSAALKLRKNGAIVNTITGSGSASFAIPISLGEYVDANGSDYFDWVINCNTVGQSLGAVFTAFPLTGMQGPTGGAPGPVVGDVQAFTTNAGSSTTPVVVVFPTIITGNSGGYLNTTTGRYTPPAGRYKLSAQVWGYSSAGGTQVSFYIRKNGTSVTPNVPIIGSAGANSNTAVTYDCIVDANGSDYFEVVQSATTALSLSYAMFNATPTQGMVGPQGPAGPANPTNVLRNFISGYVHSSAGGGSSLTVGAGSVADSTNSSWINLPSAMTKGMLGPWGGGSGNTGMGAGLSRQPNTWYFPFAILNSNLPAGVADIYFDTSPVGANAPAGTTALRRLRPIKTDGSSNIIAHLAKGDLIQWVVNINEPNSTVALVGVPPGIQTIWQGRMYLQGTTGGIAIDIFTPGATSGNGWVSTTQAGSGSGMQSAGGTISILTDTTPKISQTNAGGNLTVYNLYCYGFIDDCGRYD